MKDKKDKKRRRLTIGTVLKRRRKGIPNDPPSPWAIVQDVITAAPAPDSSEYVVVLCEGIGELAGQWFIWHTYFTLNRNGKLHFGEKGPQVPIEIDRWITEQIGGRGWYDRVQRGSRTAA